MSLFWCRFCLFADSHYIRFNVIYHVYLNTSADEFILLQFIGKLLTDSSEKKMKCSRGTWIFFVLVLLCFLVIPIRFAVFHFGPPSKYTNELFNQFKTQYNKTYGSPAEFQKRFDIFAVSVEHEIFIWKTSNISVYFIFRLQKLWKNRFFRKILKIPFEKMQQANQMPSLV